SPAEAELTPSRVAENPPAGLWLRCAPGCALPPPPFRVCPDHPTFSKRDSPRSLTESASRGGTTANWDAWRSSEGSVTRSCNYGTDLVVGIVHLLTTLSSIPEGETILQTGSNYPGFAPHAARKALDNERGRDRRITPMQFGAVEIDEEDQEFVVVDIVTGAQCVNGSIVDALVPCIAVAIRKDAHEQRM